MSGPLSVWITGLLAIGVISYLPGCSEKHEQNSSTINTENKDAASMSARGITEENLLEVIVKITETRALRSQSLPVEVQIRNLGETPLLINKRMAPGYADSQARELYAVIYRTGTDEEAGQRTQLYERDLASSTDYVWLKEGEVQTTRFDLFAWYEVPGPGDYELQVIYQADEPLAPKLEGLIEGAHTSERVGFTVTQ